jgi:hypothetical protein
MQVPVSEQYAVVVQNPVHYNIRAMVMGQVGGPEHGHLLPAGAG